MIDEYEFQTEFQEVVSNITILWKRVHAKEGEGDRAARKEHHHPYSMQSGGVKNGAELPTDVGRPE